jgi:hypothetical protein
MRQKEINAIRIVMKMIVEGNRGRPKKRWLEKSRRVEV